jgi:hypothetical protein
MQLKILILPFLIKSSPDLILGKLIFLIAAKKGNNWQVQAQSADLINNTDKTKFNGNMIFKDQSGQDNST